MAARIHAFSHQPTGVGTAKTRAPARAKGKRCQASTSGPAGLPLIVLNVPRQARLMLFPNWRKARDSGALKSPATAVPAAVHKGRPGMEAENERLAKAEVKLGQTRAALYIMGKAFALLELLSESADSPPPSAR